MTELIKFDPMTEAVILDYRMFTETFNYTGAEREAYIRFLKNTIPSFMERQKRLKPEFRLLLAEHQAKHLLKELEKDPEVKEIVRRYNAFKYIRVFEADDFLTAEQLKQVNLTQKEEQAYYIKLIKLISEGFNDVKFNQMLLTGPKHAAACSDGIVDAGITRVGSYEKEAGYIEYKIVDAEEGDVVYINGKPLKLSKNIATGGEAKIFHLEKDINQEFLAKIYCTSIAEDKPNCVKFQYLMRQRAKKLSVIFEKPEYQIDDEQIIFPIMPIYDDVSNLIGVLMKNVKAETGQLLQLHSIVKNKQYPFKEFNRIDLVNIAEQIIDRMQLLHKHNIIIGDINLRNFLVTGNSSETLKVYLIDLDGCQIPGFPALYETAGYSDPLWDPKAKKPRTKNNDVYALLILLFELFHVAHPFQYVIKQGLGQSLINDFQENMKNRDFPYVSGKRRNKKLGKQPPNEANYIYSHLAEPMQELFTKTLGEEDYRPQINEVKRCVANYKTKVTRYPDENQLEFDNFAIGRINRVKFACSFKECKGESHYRHIKDILSTLQGRPDTHLFCGEHTQWYKNIKNLENKSNVSEQERKEFSQFWQSQVEKRNLVEMAEQFFISNPNHEAKKDWEPLREKYAYRLKPKQVQRPASTNTAQVNHTPTQNPQTTQTAPQGVQAVKVGTTISSLFERAKNLFN